MKHRTGIPLSSKERTFNIISTPGCYSNTNIIKDCKVDHEKGYLTISMLHFILRKVLLLMAKFKTMRILKLVASVV
jgi:hypothetical protein